MVANNNNIELLAGPEAVTKFQLQLQVSSVVEPEPKLEPQGSETFGRSWSQYSEVPAPD
jgi:hypothetical protein